MRKIFALAMVLFALVFAMVPASAQPGPPCCLITIDDQESGPPIVTFTGIPALPTFTDNEFVIISLVGQPQFNDAAVLFNEPASDPTGPRISDVLVLFTDPNLGEVLAFASDGASQYNQLLGIAQGITNLTSVDETGDFQDVSLELGLQQTGLVAVRSIEVPVTTTPEPSSLMLLGGGWLGLVGFSRKLKK